MIRKCMGVAALVVLVGMTPAQSDDIAEVETVIRDQVAAFMENDVAGAFEYASPMIRRIFGTPENFGAMVRQGYPMVWRPSELRFGEQTRRDGRVYQTILAIDATGVPHQLEYELIPTADGWLIDGVELLAQPQVGT